MPPTAPADPERRVVRPVSLRRLGQAGRVRPAVRGVRRQRGVPALRREDVRGLQGVLQADGAEKRQVRAAVF